MRVQFAKMHGLGNDFVLFDAVNQDVQLSREQVLQIADRRRGIGCDQILGVRAAKEAGADFDYRIYNSNGEEAEQCGNGVRCIGKFLAHSKLTNNSSIRVRTVSGVYRVDLRDDGLVTVEMGVPVLEPRDIPFAAAKASARYTLQVDGQPVEIGAVSMGNPHAVIEVEDIEHAPVGTLGPRIETHSMFPNKANVGFMQVLDTRHVALRVFERGAGETAACGTGACAAVVVGRIWNRLDSKVTVQLPGGQLLVECSHPSRSVLMTGPAELSFEGSLTL